MKSSHTTFQKQSIPVYKKTFFSIAAFVQLTAIALFALARLLFAGCSISLAEDLVILLQTLGMAAIISVLLFVLYLCVETADLLLQKKRFRWSYAGLAAVVAAVIMLAASCAHRKTPAAKERAATPVAVTVEYGDCLPPACYKIINYADI